MNTSNIQRLNQEFMSNRNKYGDRNRGVFDKEQLSALDQIKMTQARIKSEKEDKKII